MTKTFTKNDLVRFVYKELSEEEHNQIKNSAIQDPELEDSIKELEVTRDSLNNVMASPSQRSIDNILAFSRDYEATGVSE